VSIRLRILLVHNFYQLPGGENGVPRRGDELLHVFEHRMIGFVRHNDEMRHGGFWRKATA